MIPTIDYDYAGSYFSFARPEIEALIPPAARRLLDVGCGAGSLGRSYKSRHQCLYAGIEPDPVSSGTAYKHLDYIYRTTAEKFTEEETHRDFDCIIFADVLEHLHDPLKILQKFKKYLAPGGIIVGSIPNVAHPIVQRELSSELFRYTNAGLLDKTHLRFFTSISIQQLLAAAGLRIKKLSAHPSNSNPYQFLFTAELPRPDPPEKKLSILILNWNTLPHLKNCINSIRTSSFHDYQILVLDQGSRPDSIHWLRQQADIIAIHSPINYGFPIGNNLLINCVNTDSVLLCNSDIIFPKDAIQYLINDLEDAPVHSVIGPAAPSVSGPQVSPPVAGKDWNGFNLACAQIRKTNPRKLTPLCRLVFFCTIFHADAFRRCGLLDESFTPGNFEDDDWCIRAIQKGYHLYYSPSIYVHHVGHGAHTANNLQINPILQRNHKIFMQKHGAHYQATIHKFYQDNPNALQLQDEAIRE